MQISPGEKERERERAEWALSPERNGRLFVWWRLRTGKYATEWSIKNRKSEEWEKKAEMLRRHKIFINSQVVSSVVRCIFLGFWNEEPTLISMFIIIFNSNERQHFLFSAGFFFVEKGESVARMSSFLECIETNTTNKRTKINENMLRLKSLKSIVDISWWLVCFICRRVNLWRVYLEIRSSNGLIYFDDFFLTEAWIKLTDSPNFILDNSHMSLIVPTKMNGEFPIRNSRFALCFFMQNVTVHLEPEHENCALVRFFFTTVAIYLTFSIHHVVFFGHRCIQLNYI